MLMGIHVNIGEAKARLSELVAAALRGEDVVVAHAGQPKVRLVPVEEAREDFVRKRGERRRAAFGMWKDAFDGWDTTVPPSMTDVEIEAREKRICGPAD